MSHLITKQIQKLITNYEPRLVQVTTRPDLIEMLTIVRYFFM